MDEGLPMTFSLGATISLFVRIPLMILLCSTIFIFEYFFVSDSDQVEISSASPVVRLWVVGGLGAFFLFTVAEKSGASRAYSFIWSWIHRMAGTGRRYFPSLISLSTLSTLNTVEDRLPWALGLPLLLPLIVLYKICVPWLQKQLWFPLFRKIVPAAFLILNGRAYSELNQSEPTVRLLRLLPGQASEPIKCQLFEANVRNADFEAVSYAWGGHLVLRRRILVNEKSFWITQNMFRALHHLRGTSAARTLWIDQICINQHSAKEKTDQVTHKMHHVYRNAKQVVVWLGPSTAKTCWAFEQARVNPEERYDEASGYEIKEGKRESDEAGRYIDAWIDIFWRKWFRRVWVVQEVALAADIVVKCGDSEMDWEMLKKTAQALKKIHKVSPSPHARSLLNFLDRPNSDDREISLLDLAIRFRKYETTDARDKLIGFLALAGDGRQYAGLDYSYQSGPVFANFTAAHIERSQSLSILALAEVRHEPFLEVTPCSWALDWGSHDMFEDPPAILWGIGLQSSAISHAACYSACGNVPASCRREQGHSSEKNVRGIFLRGWYADTVASISTVAAKWDIPTTLPIWEEFARREMPANKDLRAMFERIILAEIHQLQQERPWPEWYVPQYKDSANQDSSAPQSIRDASKIVEALCHQRRFFITVKGKLGIGPAATSVGDHVCIFEGSAVPCIVRKWRSLVRMLSAGHLSGRQFDYGRPYHFVGQTVIGGAMYATARSIEAQLETGDIQPGEIWLR